MNKTVLMMPELVDKLTYAFRVPVNKKDIEVYVRYLAEVVGEWLVLEQGVREVVRLKRDVKSVAVIEKLKKMKKDLIESSNEAAANPTDY